MLVFLLLWAAKNLFVLECFKSAGYSDDKNLERWSIVVTWLGYKLQRGSPFRWFIGITEMK